MLRLYDHPFSPYAQKVKIALREKGQAFEPPMPEGIGAGGAGGEFAAANPRAEVPPLLPQTPAERARVRMLEEVMDTHFEPITWGLGEIRNFKRATGALAEQIE